MNMIVAIGFRQIYQLSTDHILTGPGSKYYEH
jgi:hypothetical protein